MHILRTHLIWVPQIWEEVRDKLTLWKLASSTQRTTCSTSDCRKVWTWSPYTPGASFGDVLLDSKISAFEPVLVRSLFRYKCSSFWPPVTPTPLWWCRWDGLLGGLEWSWACCLSVSLDSISSSARVRSAGPPSAGSVEVQKKDGTLVIVINLSLNNNKYPSLSNVPCHLQGRFWSDCSLPWKGDLRSC